MYFVNILYISKDSHVVHLFDRNQRQEGVYHHKNLTKVHFSVVVHTTKKQEIKKEPTEDTRPPAHRFPSRGLVAQQGKERNRLLVLVQSHRTPARGLARASTHARWTVQHSALGKPKLRLPGFAPGAQCNTEIPAWVPTSVAVQSHCSC